MPVFEQGVTTIETLMRRMSEGDGDAVAAFKADHGGRIAGMVRRLLEQRGVRRLPADDLDGLVTDACLAIADVAPGWSPTGGATPWQWARHRVAAAVDRHVGQHADSIDADPARVPEAPAGVAAPDEEAPAVEVLGRLAGLDPVCALVLEALTLVARPRDRELFLEVAVQQVMGDPSPAATVAGLYGVLPTTVRQQVRRVKLRMRDLAARDARFAPLGDFALVA